MNPLKMLLEAITGAITRRQAVIWWLKGFPMRTKFRLSLRVAYELQANIHERLLTCHAF